MEAYTVVRMVDVIDGDNGDGDPIVVCATLQEFQRLTHFVEQESDQRYIIEDAYVSTVDEWIANEKQQMDGEGLDTSGWIEYTD